MNDLRPLLDLLQAQEPLPGCALTANEAQIHV
jgi:hypothetical protein